MGWGVGQLLSGVVIIYLPLLLALLFSHMFGCNEGFVEGGWVVKRQNWAAGDLFANSETNDKVNRMAEELNKVQQENELQHFSANQ